MNKNENFVFYFPVLVEKILREQPKVGHIYLVIQPRTDSTAKQRLEDQVALMSPLAFKILFLMDVCGIMAIYFRL